MQSTVRHSEADAKSLAKPMSYEGPRNPNEENLQVCFQRSLESSGKIDKVEAVGQLRT